MKLRKNAESKKAEKSLEISAFLVFSCLHLNQTRIMAGIAGLEPARAGVKVSMLQTCGASLPTRTLSVLAQDFAPARVRTLSGCLPKQPLGRAEENSVRTASRAGSQSLNATDLLCKSAYENAGRSRAELRSCTRRYKLNKPCQNSPSDEPRKTR